MVALMNNKQRLKNLVVQQIKKKKEIGILKALKECIRLT